MLRVCYRKLLNSCKIVVVVFKSKFSPFVYKKMRLTKRKSRCFNLFTANCFFCACLA